MCLGSVAELIFSWTSAFRLKKNAYFPLSVISPMFRFSICFHLIVSSFPRSFKAEDAWAVVIATKFKDMGGLTPSKKPSASQMGQKALKCTIELYIQSVSTSARVPICFFRWTTTQISLFACVMIEVIVLAFC